MSNRSPIKVVAITAIIAMAVIFIAQVVIGTKSISIGEINIAILPMLFAVTIGMVISLNPVRNKISAWGKTFTEEEESFSSKMVGFCLLVLGTQYAGMIIPNLDIIIDAGIPLIFQELGNLLPILIAIPLAVKFGMGREAIGACSSISREPSIAVIQGKYGTGTKEYIGVLAIYLCGSVIGTLWFSVLGSVGPLTGIHPLALAAGTGVGSGSMLSAASGSLVSSLSPEMAQQALSIAAASNLLSSVLGALSLTFIGIPLAEFVYKICQKKEVQNAVGA